MSDTPRTDEADAPTTDSAFDNLLMRLQWMHQGKIKPDDFLFWVDVSRQRCREVERELTAANERAERLAIDLSNKETELAEFQELITQSELLERAHVGERLRKLATALSACRKELKRWKGVAEKSSWLISQLLQDIPKSRDWLNPDLESEMKDLAKLREGES